MPKGTKVHKMAEAMQEKGMPVGQAIATAQKNTGMSYATGKPPKSKAEPKPAPSGLRAGLRGTY